MRTFFIIVLVLLYAGQWVTIAQQSIGLDTRRNPEERLIELLEQAQLNEHRLVAVAAQNEVLTTRTLAILDWLAPGSLSAPAISSCHEPDQPLVLYEAEPVKSAAKGRRP